MPAVCASIRDRRFRGAIHGGARRRTDVSGGIVEVTSLIFILVAAPVVFCALTWLVATVYRLYFPDPIETLGDLPIQVSPAVEAFDAVAEVGLNEIKAIQRREPDRPACRYAYARGFSTGLPPDWIDEMWRRRN